MIMENDTNYLKTVLECTKKCLENVELHYKDTEGDNYHVRVMEFYTGKSNILDHSIKMMEYFLEAENNKKNTSQTKYPVSQWIKFDFSNKEMYPPKPDKYFIARKDGEIHWETWNGSGWAHNHNEVVFWAKIQLPE